MATNNYNDIEKELTAIETDEAAQSNMDLSSQESQAKYEGMTRDEYLRDLERQFSLNEEISDEKLRLIEHNLKLIQNSQLPSTEASATVMEVFKNMEAWQKNMESMAHSDPKAQKEAGNRYYGSKERFMESCYKLYPNRQAMPNLAPSEYIRMQAELSTVHLPETTVRLAQMGNLETMALYVSRNLESNPVEEVQKLETIMSTLSEGVQLDLKHDLSLEEKEQLSTCVFVLYKLQTLIDAFKNYDTYKDQKKAEKSEIKTVETKTPEEIAADEFIKRPTF